MAVVVGIAVFLVALTWLMTAQASPTWRAIDVAIGARYPSVPWVTADELERWLASDAPPLLLDARSEAEFRASRLEGAMRIDPDAPATDALPTGPARVVVYCSVGWRSASVAGTLQAAGFTEVYNLRGGIFGWANSGRAVVGRSAPQVHPFDSVWGRLLSAPLRASVE